MTSNQEDSSGQAKSCSVDQPANGIVDVMSTLGTLSSQIALLAREKERLRAENAKQKTAMSTTFKTMIALKNRTIKDMEDEMKRMKESVKETTIERSPLEAVKENNEESMISEESPTAVVKAESEGEGVPKDVTTLDEVKILNELIDTDKFDLKHSFWNKISLVYGDITKINVDAIVTSVSSKLDGGELDQAIPLAAGYDQLLDEYRKHDRPVPIGQAVMTDACGLSTHVKKIIHCVGPIGSVGVTDECRNQLESCYRRAIELSEQNGLRSIAFSCISTGSSGYDNLDAAITVIKLLYKHFSSEQNAQKWDRVVLCTYSDLNKQCYKHYITQLVCNPSVFDEKSEDE